MPECVGDEGVGSRGRAAPDAVCRIASVNGVVHYRVADGLVDGIGAVGGFRRVEGVPGVGRRDGGGEGNGEEGEKGGGGGGEGGVHCWSVVEVLRWLR